MLIDHDVYLLINSRLDELDFRLIEMVTSFRNQ